MHSPADYIMHFFSCFPGYRPGVSHREGEVSERLTRETSPGITSERTVTSHPRTDGLWVPDREQEAQVTQEAEPMRYKLIEMPDVGKKM